MRRKIVRKTKPAGAQDDKKLQGALKKLNVQPIQGVEEVNMFREDGHVLHFVAPKGVFIASISTATSRFQRCGSMAILDLIADPILSARCYLCQHIRDLRDRPSEGAHRASSGYP